MGSSCLNNRICLIVCLFVGLKIICYLIPKVTDSTSRTRTQQITSLSNGMTGENWDIGDILVTLHSAL